MNHPILFQRRYTQAAMLSVSALTLMMLTSCGGGGGASSSTAPVPVASNQAPVASASSKLSVVSEGQKFELDASGSTDRDGDNLTYSWRQVSGPAVAIGSPSSATLSLLAPLLDTNEDVSFEVSVSDGSLSAVSTVSLNIENLKTNEVQSESTEYGTGGPTDPAETVPDPSIYEGQKPLDQIIGLTPENDGQYRVHWTSSAVGHDMPVSSQGFSAAGEKMGAQTDGVFLGGDGGTYEKDGQTYNRFSFGITFATVKSGDTLFNFNGKLQFGDEFTIGYTTYRGLVEGEVDGFGDELIAQRKYTQKTMGGAYTPVGQDKVVLTLSERTTDDADDAGAVVVMTSEVVDRFGQTLSHELGRYMSNGTASPRNKMTVTSFEGGSYLAAWAQNTIDDGYDIRLQRATQDGVLLGSQVTVNSETAGDQLHPLSATLTGGNIVVAWLHHTETEEGGRQIRARVMQPNGSFVTEDVTLGPALPTAYAENSANQPFYMLTPLNTNELLLTWEQEMAGEEGEAASPEIRALVLDAELNIVSNEFLIADGGPADAIRSIQAITLPDNRVVMGWFNDYPYQDERDSTTHTVGFYPVGKE